MRFRRSVVPDQQIDQNFFRVQEYLPRYHQGIFSENGTARNFASDNVWRDWSANTIQFRKVGGLLESEVYVDFGVSNYSDIAGTLSQWRIKATHANGTVKTSDVTSWTTFFLHQAANSHIFHAHTVHFGLDKLQTLIAGVWDFKIQELGNGGIFNVHGDGNDYMYMRIHEVPLGAMLKPDSESH